MMGRSPRFPPPPPPPASRHPATLGNTHGDTPPTPKAAGPHLGGLPGQGQPEHLLKAAVEERW